MADDKENMDFITAFNVKRKAVYKDYYDKHGTPEERAQGWTHGLLTHQGTDAHGDLKPINSK